MRPHMVPTAIRDSTTRIIVRRRRVVAARRAVSRCATHRADAEIVRDRDPRTARARRIDDATGARHLRAAGCRVLAAVFVVWVAIVEARLVCLQVVQHEALLERAEEQQQSRSRFPAPRGDIVDRDGIVLAMTVRGYALEATPLADQPIPTALGRPPLPACSTGCDAGRARGRWRSSCAGRARARATSSCAARSPRTRRRRIDALDEPHVRVVSVPHRYYPSGETAAHVLGFVNIDNEGQTGIELAMDDRSPAGPACSRSSR